MYRKKLRGDTLNCVSPCPGFDKKPRTALYLSNLYGGNPLEKIILYTLSTCGHCKKTKSLLHECNAEYNCTDVDLLEGKEREAAIAAVKECNPRLSFPTLVIGETVIIGFKEEEIRKALDT